MEPSDILPIIKKRRSVKKYLPQVPDWEQITRVVEAGRYAPSCGNLQNWSFIVCYDPGVRGKIAQACLEQYWMQEAPIHIVVCAQPNKAERYYGLRGERLYSVQNCAAASMNIILEAESLGLATCWVGAFEEEALKRILHCEEFIRPQAVITMGYAAGKVAKPPKYPIETVMYLNKWRNKVKDPAKYSKDYAQLWEKNYRTFAESLKKGVQKGKEFIRGKI